MGSSLRRYRQRRRSKRTPEPTDKRSPTVRSGRRRFVIHKHDASSLHYDLRLEVDGVLKSWAVPKGPSTDPRVRRLAIQTEDHPLAYASFEGVIPRGEYGAGTVLVWDQGSYANLRARRGGRRRSMSAALRDGLVEVWLEGQKLRGGFALKRIRNTAAPQWLLVKIDDSEADARRRPTSTQPKSVRSNRSLTQIQREATHD